MLYDLFSSPHRASGSIGARSASGQSRRFCDVCFSVRYPQYRTFTSDWDWPACRLAAPELQTTGAGAAAPAFCPRPAKRHELHLRSTKTRHINCANPRGSCSRHACPGFCPMAVWRTIAQDRRGADNRPLDSRIKGARCAAVGRVSVQRLIATFLAQSHLARIQVLFCAQEVGTMCLVLPRRQCLSRRCRTSRHWSRLAPCAPGSAADGLDKRRLPRP